MDVYNSAAAVIRDPLGFLMDGPDTRQWRIKFLDGTRAGQEIVGDFEPRNGVDLQAGASVTQSSGLGDQGSLVSFVGGQSDSLSVTVELFSDGVMDDISGRLDELLSLVRRDPKIKRIPICRFSWGTWLARDVMFVSAPFRIIRLWANGSPAQVAVSLSMVQVSSLEIETTDPSALPPESIEVVAAQGDTFELIAQRYYGDPMLGWNLRHRHPELEGGVAVPGTRILVVDREHDEIRAPARRFSPPLASGDGLDTAFAAHLQSIPATGTVPEL